MRASTLSSLLSTLVLIAIVLSIGALCRADDLAGRRDTNRAESSGSSRTAVRTPPDLEVTPTRGQNPQQQARDLNECHARAVAQAGYDPNHASTGFQVGRKRLDYDHALSVCLENRGYTVK